MNRMPLTTHMVYDSPNPRETPRISISKKTTPHPMVSLATKPNQPLHPWHKYRVSPTPKTDIQEKDKAKESKSARINTNDGAGRNDEKEKDQSQIIQQCPSNADVVSFPASRSLK